MVSLTSGELRETYGIDLPTLRRSCPGALIGVASCEGVIWHGEPGRESLPAEDRLLDIVRSRGADECLFMLLDGGGRQALEEHICGCSTGVTRHWVDLRRGACCVLLAKNTET